MPKTPESGSPPKPLAVRVVLDGKPEHPIAVTAYAFDRRGALVASAPERDGKATLPLAPEELRRTRIFLAAAPPDEREITLDSMARLGAYEPVLRYDSTHHALDALEVPEAIWHGWLWCRCRARGRVVRPIEVGGVSYDRPVCHARVHVCEADRIPRLIERLPDSIAIRWRDALLGPTPPPVPEPVPPFRVGPRIGTPTASELTRPLAASLATHRGQSGGETANIGYLETALAGPLAAELPIAARATLSSSDPEILKRNLALHVDLLRPWFCLWPWLWPYLCTYGEITTVLTDEQGRFETDVFYRCVGDRPDLYFWVEYCIGGAWDTVYRPTVCCHTFWDYTCGSEVTIRVTDPRVPWCGDRVSPVGKQIAIVSIGREVGPLEVQGVGAAESEGLTSDGRPFGGSLEPAVWFGDGLRDDGITHYRWSYRRLGSTLASDWHAVDGPVVRHYAEIVTDGTLTFKPFSLGPDPAFLGQALFKIRPEDPPIATGAVSSFWAPEVDARTNSASAFWLSHLLDGGNAATAAGKYELKLELFDSTGARINLGDRGVQIKVPTVAAPYGLGEVPTELVAQEDRLIRDADGKIVAYRLVLHVDNNHCQAEIKDVTVGGTAAGPCGFLSYTAGSSALVHFLAHHPNGFATFDFSIAKGSCGGVAAASASGPVAFPANGFIPDSTGVYSKPVPVGDLLDGGACGSHCTKAAFAEILNVAALATDGWSSLTYLNASGVPHAFALEPEPA